MPRSFQTGQFVKIVTHGTAAMPIAERYVGRRARVMGKSKWRGRTVYELDFFPRRVTPLEVPVSAIEPF